MNRIAVLIALLGAGVPALPAIAGDAPPDFDATFEATVATDYFSDGLTQSDHQAVFQSKVALSYGILYGSVFGSTIDYGTPDPDSEWEIIAGIAPTVGDWTFDVSVTRYQYPGDADDQYTYLFGSATYDFGNGLSLGAGYAYYWYDTAADYNELYAAADYAFDSGVTLHGEVSYDIDYDGAGNDYMAPQAGVVVPLPENFELSANLGYEDYFNDPASPSYFWYDAGIAYALTDWAKLDLRYYGNDLGHADCPAYTATSCAGRVVAAFRLSRSLSSLRALVAPAEPGQAVRPLAGR